MDTPDILSRWHEHLTHMRHAISLEKTCLPEDARKKHPMVGVVVVHPNGITTAYRGERQPGEHAEYTALVKKLGKPQLQGATLYTTLEPCTTRRHPKRPCYEWILEVGITRVVIGILDPNPEICGIGEWILKSNGVLVDRFPAELQSEIEADNKEFIAEQKAKLLKRVKRLREYLSLSVPCAHCAQMHHLDIYTCESVTNQYVKCSACGRGFFVHLIGDKGDFFTTKNQKDGYGIPPAEGLSLPVAIRRQLKRSQLWVEPRQLPGLLSLMRDTEQALVASGGRLTPYTLMQSMVKSAQLSQYAVKTESIRQFCSYLVNRGYFSFATQGSGPPRHWNYSNPFDEKRALQYYLRACLSILRRNGIVGTFEVAVEAGEYLLKETHVDAAKLVQQHWKDNAEHGRS